VKWQFLLVWIGGMAVCGCGEDDGDSKGGGQKAGNVLEIEGRGEQCIACMEDKCAAEVRACNKDAACLEIATCTKQCHNGQKQCNTHCVEEYSCADVDSQECDQRQECLWGCNTFSTECPNQCNNSHPSGTSKSVSLDICWSEHCVSDCPFD